MTTITKPFSIMSILLATALCSTADTTIPIYFASPGDIIDATPRFEFPELDGTPVAGSLSVDFMFAQGEFARVFSVTGDNFDCQFILQTSGNGLVGFLGGSGYLIDKNGNPIPGYGVTGSASSDSGWMTMGLFPLWSNDNGAPDPSLSQPFDFYGVHFDINLPAGDQSLVITDGQFFITAYSPWGIGPGLPTDIPEPSMLALLIGAAISAVLASKREKLLD